MKEVFESKIMLGFIIFVLGFTYLTSVQEVNCTKKDLHENKQNPASQIVNLNK